MKINAKLSGFLLLLFTLSLQSCFKDSCEREVTWVEHIPVYMTLDEMRQDISFEAPRELEQPGKIYFYNNYILVNERRVGIHLIDNTNPASPQKIGFIAIGGNVDMAVRNGILYADNYLDLLSINITDPTNPQLISRTEEAFPPLYYNEETGEYVVYHDTKVHTDIVDCQSSGVRLESIDMFSADVNTASNAAGGDGTGGSMARFTLYDDYLYTVDDSDLRVFDLTTPTQPVFSNTVSIGWGIETIFPYTDKLFIGSQSGMFIYDVADPLSPAYMSEFRHATACDPVFVKDNYAYVTLRDGTPCQGFINELDLIDITDLTNPQLVEVFEMDNPHGLSIDGETLFLCEGEHGLKTFDIEEPEKLDKRQLDELRGLHAYDVIAVPGPSNLLLVIGDDGLYQYNYDKPDKLELVSSIPVN